MSSVSEELLCHKCWPNLVSGQIFSGQIIEPVFRLVSAFSLLVRILFFLLTGAAAGGAGSILIGRMALYGANRRGGCEIAGNQTTGNQVTGA